MFDGTGHDPCALSARRIGAVALVVAGILEMIAAGFTATKPGKTAIIDVAGRLAYCLLLANAPSVIAVDLLGLVALMDCVFRL